MFEKLNKVIDEVYNDALDQQYRIQIMAAEMKLCYRLEETPDMLQFKYSIKKIWSDKK